MVILIMYTLIYHCYLEKCVLCYVIANNYWGDMVKLVPSAPHSVEMRLK